MVSRHLIGLNMGIIGLYRVATFIFEIQMIKKIFNIKNPVVLAFVKTTGFLKSENK